MSKLLIGDTGLVGQSIKRFESFDHYFNSKNLIEFADKAEDGDELFLTCLPAAKWKVNQNLLQDLENINSIIHTVSKTKYSKVTLISTIDVYIDSPLDVDESYGPNVHKLSYGSNRYLFELLAREYIKTESLKVFRLPALFNTLIKKNILFDLIHNNNIEEINRNSIYQWYNLDNLGLDIKRLSEEYPKETLYNLFTEPIHTEDLLEFFPEHCKKVQKKNKVVYNYRTKFGGYLDNRQNVLQQIEKLINEFRTKQLCIQ